MTVNTSRRTFVSGAAATLAASIVPADSFAAGGASGFPIRRGINLWPWFSLTREFAAPRRDYDWPPFQTQRAVPTPGDLQRLRAAGFDFARLPIDPGPFLAMRGRQRRDLLDMLSRAVDTVLSADLRLVVNLQSNEATHYWNSGNLTASVDAPEFSAYRALVADVAEILSRHPADRVALEPVNEPSQACGSAAWDKVQRQLLTTARSHAPNLMLVATGSCGSMVSGLTALDPAPLELLAPLIYTFHFYEPYLFSHQGAPWMSEPVYRALNQVPWPASAGSLEVTLAAVKAQMEADGERTAAQKRAAYAETEKVLKVYFDAQPSRGFVDGYLSQVAAWGTSHGITPARILMGEFGALRSDSRYIAAPAPDRARYVEDVRRSAEALGFPWAFWNMFDGMGVVTDDVDRRFDLPIVRALGLTDAR
ncbi:glycoside hydrolase family 5 protein [Rhizobium sp. SAFR-030]|uniref:glycoside hydrolase family 5 protein n=1 Tax=Rhizobium sp. SAFR-030 TaxID=3387277 RepID=UPI003F7FDCF7